MGAHDRQGGIKPPRRQRPHLLQGPRSHHGVEPRVDAGVERRALGRQKQAQAARGVQQAGRARALKGRKAPPRGLEDLQRPQDALGVAGPQPRRGLGVQRREPCVQGRGVEALGFSAHPRPHLLRHGGNIREAAQQALEIHAGAASEDRQAPLPAQLLQGAGGVREPEAHRIIHSPVHMAEEHMGRGGLLGLARARAQNPQIPVNLHGIRIHHGPAQALRQSDRQSGLAAGGRSCDENGLRPRRAHAGGLPEACERP